MSTKDNQQDISGKAGAGASPDFAGGKAALTEANRHADILYTSLAGVAAIVVVLLAGIALPVFGHAPISSFNIFMVMILASLAGVGELCFINYRAHNHVTQQARLTEVLLNSLGQGFLTFNPKGECGAVYSQACLDLLEVAPAGLNIVDVLRLPQEQRADFKDWLDMLFATGHALSFDDVVKFLPQSFLHSCGRQIALVYRPVHDAHGALLKIVLIATDQTEEAEAQLRAKAQQNFVNMICRIFKERNQFLVTITHLRKFIEEATEPGREPDPSSVLRLLHTLKAAAKHFHLDGLGDVIRRLEVDLHALNMRGDPKFKQELTKGGEEVDGCLKAVLDQVGDLIGQDYEGRGSLHEVDEVAVYNFARTMREQKIHETLIQQYLLTIVAVPIQDTFHQFERELKDLAEIMGKKIKPLSYAGSNPRVLVRPLEGLLLSMMHIFRNIIDHGIEPVVTRLARGKEPAGQVTVKCDVINNPHGPGQMLQIVITDDGNGIDPALVRAKLAKIDPNGAWQQDDDQAVIQRIMLWEVSTKTDVTDLSGRGVGMEAVDREVRLLGGTLTVSSELYRWTQFDIRIPYCIDVPLI